MNHPPTTHDQLPASRAFRHDVNGLRAWAVVAVMLYHFGVPGFSGGFVGVDVFFVISGFLMTGIVVSGLERQGASGFSVLAFYMARARRILPALIVLCAVLLILGWRLLLPPDYMALGAQVAFSLAFVSNIKFWREAGYFDSSSHEKWLLHTWSLAVEWQFYLLLPVVLVAIWKWRAGRKSVAVVMITGLLASFVSSIIATPLNPTAAFYFLPTRAWEMLAGGVVYLQAYRCVLTERRRMVLELIGMALVIGAVVGFDTSSLWPGWRAAVPVSGAVAVLLAARSSSYWTGNPIAQWLGNRSYSIYLWHWPIVVALTYLEWQTDPRAVASGFFLALVLGHFSYHWVENPARQQLSRHRLRWSAVAMTFALVVVAAPAAGIRWKDGVSGRFSASVDQVAAESTNMRSGRDKCFATSGTRLGDCVYGGDRLRAILIGDSHADAVVTALAAALPNSRDSILDWTYTACLTARGVKSQSRRIGPENKCGEFLEAAFVKLKQVPKDVPVIIVNRTSAYASGYNDAFEHDANIPWVYFDQRYQSTTPASLSEFAQRVTDTACELAADRVVYMMRPIPEMRGYVPNVTARAMAFGIQKDVSISLAEYHQRHAFVWATQDAARERCGVKILDPLPYLCADGRCSGTKSGRPIFYDDNHLSEFGNKLLVPMFAQVFRKD